MDALRLLGGLTRGTLRRSMPGNAKVAIGMGLLGVAIAAWEHYQQQQNQRSPAPGPLPPPPPPSPAGAGATPPAPPPGATQEAEVLVRAMAAAAAADGVIDADERRRILARLEGGGLGPEERGFLEQTLSAPPTLDAVIAEIGSPHLAEQAYAVSLLAVTLDSDAERAYLRELARRLALDAGTVSRLHQMIGVPLP